MTPIQRKRLAEILLKEDQEGWRVSVKWKVSEVWRRILKFEDVDGAECIYKAERIEITPVRDLLPIEHYKLGMEVKIGCSNIGFVIRQSKPCLHVWDLIDLQAIYYDPAAFASWRWPNETEWKPTYTETIKERVLETLTMEGL